MTSSYLRAGLVALLLTFGGPALAIDTEAAFVILLAILSSTPRIKGDLPFVYCPDEPGFVYTAVKILRDADPNPHWFSHPASPTIYLLAGLYSVGYGTGRLLGFFHSANDFKEHYQVNPTFFYLSGRSLSIIFGGGTVVLVYWSGRRLFGLGAGVFAAAALALSPVHIGLSRLVRADTAMIFFALLTFWYTMDIIEHGGSKRS